MPHSANATPAHRVGFTKQAACRVLAGLMLCTAAATACAAQDAPPLRVCLDPENPPFSSDKPGAPGFYVELAQSLAGALGRPFEPVWTLTYFGKRAVRTTLLDRKCDAFIGLPETDEFMGPRVLVSRPILQLGYTLVMSKTRSVASFADLSGLRVAVQFGSPPAAAIATHEDIHPVTAIETAQAMQSLVAGEADVAFIWGPTAGNINKMTLNGAYKIVPVAGPGMQWEAAVGVPRGQTALHDQVDAALATLVPAIAALKDKYGFPSGAEAPVTLADAGQPPVQLAAASAAVQTDAQPAPVADAAEADAAVGGHELFNENCSHCHGPDAVQAQRNIDLRRLQKRYGDRAAEMFTYTVHHGRPDKGMPNWDGVLGDDVLDKIKVFLLSIQTS